jgi:exodeoxyribonuclease VII large subunit
MNRLTNLSQSLQKGTYFRVQKYEERLSAIQQSYVLKRPVLMIDQFIQQLDQLQDRSIRSSRDRVNILGSKLDGYAQQLKVLNPLSILNRGYSVLSNTEGKIIRSVEQIEVKEQLVVRLFDGEAETRVEAIKPKK